MKLTFTSGDGSLKVEGEPKTIKDAFEFMGMVNEYLIPEPCGKCKSKATYPMAKHVQEYTYYEWVCRDCHATFTFGQARLDGRLFPKRKDPNGRPLANGGWMVFGEQPKRDPHSQEPSREPQDYAQPSPDDDPPY